MNPLKPLSENNRNALKDVIFDAWRDTMFAKDAVEDYIKYGVSIRGIEDMTDEQLLSEYLFWLACDESEDELYNNCVLDIEAHKMLSE